MENRRYNKMIKLITKLSKENRQIETGSGATISRMYHGDAFDYTHRSEIRTRIDFLTKMQDQLRSLKYVFHDTKENILASLSREYDIVSHLFFPSNLHPLHLQLLEERQQELLKLIDKVYAEIIRYIHHPCSPHNLQL